ncbi:DEAD/DEAH box helicase [Frankia sp. AgB1.9]|uniref:DEAD/DEAH box helicase n=1 Tax=unclassified Frankia TaxID=2632575 RepID=UPI001933DD86|nr:MULTISPECIES: DEAD/DEAH box helicase [unclassified Frankia]MBL7487317.1 DEAD/DEAH box helicase [Frankia sp. AgW1.1]MBL7546324.1 DEAD/DEAH box helicase [Frankia sp. AgB1.9]MBL7618631.1 DEAD/DEAH box helicase [Frankia sp. AgB1.8]
MKPTLEAQGLKESLLQYLTTTYALADEGAREALHRFLGDETSGMFRGPFLRVRTPFALAEPGWEQHLEWRPERFFPYAHQAAAFARLTSAQGHVPEPTLVTTGTGSGKTESFLYPVLDHCRRERAVGRAGVKAVLLYPMNALATDQANRINELLTIHTRDLNQVWAGLYIGDKAAVTYDRVLTSRSDMRLSPPDILITNYKMLDQLLHRGEDVALWAGADIRYVVVDEFHTYDGAQGTDVAMLLRRLASAVGAAEPGRPLGAICPVATSATLASAGESGLRDLLDVASQVFGTAVTADAVIGESRQSVDDFIPSGDLIHQSLPTPEELLALPNPSTTDDGLARLAAAVTDEENLDPFALAERLRHHVLTRAVLLALGDEVRTGPEILDLMWRHGAANWSEAVTRRPEKAAEALARFVALLSWARDPASRGERTPRPFVHVEVHQWARAVSQLLRGVLPWPRAEFRWDVAGTMAAVPDDGGRVLPAATTTAVQAANVFLPAVYCRACGRSGWAVFSPESDDAVVEFDTFKIRRASVGPDKLRVRALIAATDEEALAGARLGRPGARTGGSTLLSVGGEVQVLDTMTQRLRIPVLDRDFDPEKRTPRLAPDSAFVLVQLGPSANTAAEQDWCPACGERNAIRFLGTGPAALAAASITQLFTSGELDRSLHEDKTLMFNDSVQDAAHRAGFVATRSFTFSLRALLVSRLSTDAPTALNDLIADVITAVDEAPAEDKTLSAVVPPDLHGLRPVERLLSGKGGDRATWDLIGQRLAFDTLMEFGFRSRNGRTLELTRTAAAHVLMRDPAGAAAMAREIHRGLGRTEMQVQEQDDARYLALLRVFLERLRTRGAVAHQWLGGYLDEAGTNRYQVWGGRPLGMRAFPRGIAAPKFLLAKPKNRTEFDVATGRLSWYERWAQRCLEVTRDQADEFWSEALPALVRAGLLAVHTPLDSSARVYGLLPGAIEAELLTDDKVRVAFVRCPVCFWEQTVHPSLLDQWRGQPCPSYRCRDGRLVAGDQPAGLGRHHRDRDYTQDYYRRLYRTAGPYHVITAEHTGMLTRPQRERVEKAFRDGEGFKAPNVLSCTPTLELGIDVGDLSAVVLAALPRRPANYAQQVGRAGRRTGNAFLLTILDRRRRDLYFMDQPKDMIAGTIVPPGCYLSAVEILRRQYLAHLLDLAAAGRLPRPDEVPLRPLPTRAPKLFGPSGYLVDLVTAALHDGAALVERFLGLFPTGISEQAQGELRGYATGGLAGAVEAAEREWRGKEEALRNRLRAIGEARDELHDSNEEQAVLKAELDAEHRAVGRRLLDLGQTPASTALCDLGLLPNYALIDAVTTLSAAIYGPESVDPITGKIRFTSDLVEYERPRRLALSELAPGNSFYVNGYRHQVTGLEIATDGRRDWLRWRFCPECGYVRTDNATEDRSPCPRCSSVQIADDGSCLFQVVEPVTVTSRDKQEDARISDDHDERERRFYTEVDAVDFPADRIEPGSWRHTHQTFGVDYCRTAMIRRVNVGPMRFDAQARDQFAGHRLRLAPFFVCTGCGAATADGQPVFNPPSDALSESATRDPALRHHRPWCPLRRGKRDAGVTQEPVLLAHQLRTEALRVLLPVASADVDERVESLRAALRMGVDLHFGGDPQHLATTIASMPDRATGERRWFLVLFDSLPGGTGYLDRLTAPDAMRDTLRAAYDKLLDCPCAEEQRRACHRCLHLYAPESRQDVVSRRAALAMLEPLLFDAGGGDGWDVTAIEDTGTVGLDQQVESDLEARFLATLRTWARITDDVALDEEGHASGHLRFTAGNEVVHWRLTAQDPADGTRPDFTFTRVDGPRQKVHVYLEGFRFHATHAHNRIAHDAAKRARLRARRDVVFQITWDDLDLFGGSREAVPVWPPYGGQAEEAAREGYERLGGQRAQLGPTVFANPIASLIAYLRAPAPTRWLGPAGAMAMGLLRSSGIEQVVTTDQAKDVARAVRGELRALAGDGRPSAVVPDGSPGHLVVFRARDDAGLPLVVILDMSEPEAPRWTVLAILDDRDAALDDPAHRLRWRAWLYWTNLTQFLAFGEGDGVQLAASEAADFPVEVLRACDGMGELDSLPGVPAPDLPSPVAVPEQPVPAGTPSHGADALADPGWTDILEILRDDPADNPDLLRLAEALVGVGAPAPVFGYELGAHRWLAEFGWDEPARAAVVVPHEPGDDEGERRVAAYLAAGWTVNTAVGWLEHLEDLRTLLLPDPEGA